MPIGTEISVPTGSWKVIDTKTGIKGGDIKNYKKTPYGNSIFVQNTETGEKLRFSHLSEVNVFKGDILDTGSYIGKSGETGNVTGPHLDIEYYDPKGTLADVMKTVYGKYYTGQEYTDDFKKKVYGDINKGISSATSTATDYLKKLLPFGKEEVDLNDYILNYL